MECKEQLLYFFLSGKISLSQYDYKFMVNLQTMIHDSHRVTSNQAELFDKLISKYAKQLTKAALVKEELQALLWKAMVVQSTPEYTGANISLFDDIITVRVPFNKIFIAYFRGVDGNPFEWIKEERLYRAPFSTVAFKLLYHTLPKYFTSVKYCETLSNILEDLKQYEGLVWEPTLMNVNGKLILGAANTVVAELISDIDLTISADSLYKLSSLQFPAQSNVYGDDPKLKFAYEYVTEVDIDNISQVAKWMRSLKVQRVLLDRTLSTDKNFRSEIETALTGIPVVPATRNDFNRDASMYPSSFLLQTHSHLNNRLNTYVNHNIDKIVVLKNSRPVETK
jgi:hypothetical protein